MSKFGIDLFLTGTTGFKGCIKKISEDFEVREISLEDGGIASLDIPGALRREPSKEFETAFQEKDIASTEDKTDVDPKPNTNKRKMKADLDGTEGKKMKTPQTTENEALFENTKTIYLKTEEHSVASRLSSPLLCAGSEGTKSVKSNPLGVGFVEKKLTSEDLTPVFDDEKLEERANSDISKLLGTIEASNLHSFANKLWSSTCPLQQELYHQIKAPIEKEPRRKLHQAIRYCYPYLLTDISKDSNGCRHFLIHYNIIFKEFMYILNLDECNAFFRFVYCRDYVSSDQLCFTGKEDRKNRTNIHSLINRHFGSLIESKTFTLKGLAVKRTSEGVKTNQNTSNIHIRMKAKDFMEKRNKKTGFYTHFVLRKENCETLDALLKLSRVIGCQLKSLSYAGTKDKKAITYQWVSLEGFKAAGLLKYENQSLGNIRIGKILDKKEPLRLGDLAGNWFKVRLRDVGIVNDENSDKKMDSGHSHLNEILDDFTNSVSKYGFINYFGLQRFGFEDSDVSAPDIGLAFLKRNFRRAVELILMPTGCADDADKAKEHFRRTNDIIQSLKIMPGYKKREIIVLGGLKRYGFDDEGCRKSIYGLPYATRLMYIHSYISLLWNRAVNYRLVEYGPSVILGDLVLVKAENQTDGHFDVREVNENDIKLRRFHISDVVLPLPGYKSVFPGNRLALYYKEQLEKVSLTEDSFRVKELGLNVPGSYRHILRYPYELKWKIIEKDAQVSVSEEAHVEPFLSNFLVCDARPDIIIQENIPARIYGREKQPFNSGDGNFLSTIPQQPLMKELSYDVLLTFALPTSSYATMFLRELMKS